MKTAKYLLLVTILFGFQIQMRADNTDVSTLDNVVYIEPFSAPAGSFYTISVKMKNSVDAVGFYFDLILPDGITVPTKNGSKKPMAYLSTERTNSDNTGFIADYKLDGTLQVQAYDNGGLISGNNGEIATIVINIANDMPEGDYPIQLKNTGVVQTNSFPLRTDLVETSITVTAPADTRVPFDENSDNSDVLKATTGVDVRVLRTIKTGEWSTICLPFAMTESQVKEAFGDDVELADFDGIESTYDGENVTGIQVKFNTVNAIDANHPYIIKVSTPITEFTADAVDITPSAELSVHKDEQKVKIGSTWYTFYNSFVGTFVANTNVPENCLFLNDNKFWYSTGITKMKAFRAYFEFLDILTEVEEAGVKIFIAIDDEEDGIGEMVNSKVSNSNCYDLGGRMVAKPVQRGVYIQNGKKILK